MAALLLAMGSATIVEYPEARQAPGGVRLAQLGSPTGREPRLIWTPERQAVWSQMRADYEASPASPRTLGGQVLQAHQDQR